MARRASGEGGNPQMKIPGVDKRIKEVNKAGKKDLKIDE